MRLEKINKKLKIKYMFFYQILHHMVYKIYNYNINKKLFQ